MIRHIALFTLNEQADGKSKAENIEQIKHNVQGLADNINTIRFIECRENFHDDESVFKTDDLCVYAEFETKDDYDIYFHHPVHRKAAQYAGSVSKSVHAITIED